MPNYYKCSDGSKISEAGIKAKLSAAYREFYLFEPLGSCEGCGEPAQGTAHIVPKARLKQIGKTEFIWNPIDFMRACHRCNSVVENVSSDDILKMKNYDKIKKVLTEYDPERASKLPG